MAFSGSAGSSLLSASMKPRPSSDNKLRKERLSSLSSSSLLLLARLDRRPLPTPAQLPQLNRQVGMRPRAELNGGLMRTCSFAVSEPPEADSTARGPSVFQSGPVEES